MGLPGLRKAGESHTTRPSWSKKFLAYLEEEVC